MNNKRSNTRPQADEFEDDFAEQPLTSARKNKANHLIAAILGRWYWMALFTIIGLLCSLYYLSKAPKIYSASSYLVVTLPNLGGTGFRAQSAEFDTSTVEGLNTIAQRVSRPALMMSVAAREDVKLLEGIVPKKVNWQPDWWVARKGAETPQKTNTSVARQLPAEVIAGIISQGLSVDVVPKTRLLRITFKHQVPTVAEALANAVALEYVAEARKSASDSSTSQSSALDRNIAETSRKLSDTNNALGNYARALEVNKSLEELEASYSQLSLRYRPKYPDMVELAGRIKNSKESFLSELKTAISSPVDAEYWKAKIPGLNAFASDPDAYLVAARQALLARLSVLNADAKSYETLIQSMSISRGMGNLANESSDVTIRMDTRAQGAGKAGPDEKKAKTAGCGFGFALGAMLAFLLAKLDNKFHSVAELEGEAEVPVLASITQFSLAQLKQVRKMAAKRGKTIELNELQELWDPFLLFTPGLSSTNFCESFRVLRTSLSLLGDESRRRVTLITSSLSGEGKSTVSANLALAAAGQGKKTLLVDFDLRKPRQHRVFGFVQKGSNQPGATEWCARKATLTECVVTQTGAENLHVVFSGTRAPNPGELLDSERIREMIEEAKGLYDVIILDTAPMLPVPDTRLIAPFADNICVVVRSGYAPKGAVLRTLDLLDSYGTSPSGLILNAHAESRGSIGQNYSYGNYRMSKFGKPYQYGYGSYGSYGAYGSDDDDEDETESRKTKRKRSKQ